MIEEVRDVDLAQLTACRSLLRQAMLHLLKLHAWPDRSAVSHWRSEVRTFLVDAEDRFTPFMRQRIDLGELYAKVAHLMREEIDASRTARPLPEHIPSRWTNCWIQRRMLLLWSARLEVTMTADDRPAAADLRLAGQTANVAAMCRAIDSIRGR